MRCTRRLVTRLRRSISTCVSLSAPGGETLGANPLVLGQQYVYNASTHRGFLCRRGVPRVQLQHNWQVTVAHTPRLGGKMLLRRKEREAL